MTVLRERAPSLMDILWMIRNFFSPNLENYLSHNGLHEEASYIKGEARGEKP